ncbi:hypothetical protein P7K49_027953 [Saguinus oedipus]|uniref:Uncharacterized protein n=1 Tax=Saguinus oedipus TaxID=9490 RepID=A0ABQ9UBW2_SAGOE|nr:hypothetical protein P7K49_027953 [Saguinus oedipus]
MQPLMSGYHCDIYHLLCELRSDLDLRGSGLASKSPGQWRSNCAENIRKHILHTGKHEGVKMYNCPKCDYGTNVPVEFRNHLKEQHPDIENPDLAYLHAERGLRAKVLYPWYLYIVCNCNVSDVIHANNTKLAFHGDPDSSLHFQAADLQLCLNGSRSWCAVEIVLIAHEEIFTEDRRVVWSLSEPMSSASKL